MLNQCENVLEVRGPEYVLRKFRLRLNSTMLRADLDSIGDRMTVWPDAFIVTYPTASGPELDALAALADRNRSLTFTLLYHERSRGVRGYAMYGPGSAWKTSHEEHADLDARSRLFPSHYPVPRGSETLAAAARKKKVSGNDRLFPLRAS